MPNKVEIRDPDGDVAVLPDSPAEWQLETSAFHFANDPNIPDDARDFIRELWKQFVLREDMMIEPIMRREIRSGPCIYCGYDLTHFMLSGPSRYHMHTFEASVECGRCRSQGPNVNGQESLQEAEEIALKAWQKPLAVLNEMMRRRTPSLNR
jgi:hypothetical protein